MTDWVQVAHVEELPPAAVAWWMSTTSPWRCSTSTATTARSRTPAATTAAELASGELQGEEIICPRQGARFNLRSGAVTAPPAYNAVAVFTVRIAVGRVEVRDDGWD